VLFHTWFNLYNLSIEITLNIEEILMRNHD